MGCRTCLSLCLLFSASLVSLFVTFAVSPLALLLKRDSTPRCALGLIRLLLLASRRALEVKKTFRLLLQQQQQQQLLLHRLSDAQLRALEGALRHEAAAAAIATAGGKRGDRRRPKKNLFVFSELSNILVNAHADPRTSGTAMTAMRLIVQHLGSTDTNW